MDDLTIRVGEEYDADAQEHSFMNATLQELPGGWAVSIACFIYPGHEPGKPENAYSVPELASYTDVLTYVESTLEDAVRLTGSRLRFDVEIGPMETPEPDLDDES